MDRTATPKMTKEDKRAAKATLSEFRANGGDVFSLPEDRMTVAVMPMFEGSKFVKVSAAFCADHEPKFRKWIGIDLAMWNLQEQCEFVCVRRDAGDTLEDVAMNFATMNAPANF